MNEKYIVCRPGENSQPEIAATFTNKDQADRELDRLNAFRDPGSPEWHLLVKS
jgi:hypothetical protein